MTSIPAKILAVDNQADKHRVIVRILLRKYRGSFNTLKFGENTPFMGSCHDGQLISSITEIQGLRKGNRFRYGRFSNTPQRFSSGVCQDAQNFMPYFPGENFIKGNGSGSKGGSVF
jgi:hypothetical protein